MYRKFRLKLFIPGLFALAVLTVQGLLPLALTAGAEFLGKDVSGLASSIVAYYPWYFIRELSAILVVCFGLFLLIGVLFYYLRTKYPHLSRIGHRIVFPFLPIVVIVLIYLASIYEYPALYEAILPLWFQRFVFGSASFFGPDLFRITAGLLVLAAIGLVGYRQKMVHIQIGAVVTAIFGAAVIYLPTILQQRRSNADKPNVLLIAIDSLRMDHAVAEVMPELTKMIADTSSVVFKNHYVGIPRTFPSWMEMLYARNSPQTSVRHMFPGFGDRRQYTRSMPQVLKDAGYRTSVISDFAGDIFPRFDGGFDHVLTPSMNLRALIELAAHQKFPLFLPVTTTWPISLLFPALDQNPAFANPKKLARRASMQMVADNGPWFSTVFFSTAHFPYAVPYPFYRKFTDPEYLGPFYFQKNPEITGEESLTEANIAQTRGLYSGALAAIDASISEIFSALKKRGEWDRTVIVVTADHGEDLYENGRLQGHGEHLLGRNVIKVPLVIRVPNKDYSTFDTGSAITRSIDIGPTVLGALGLTWPEAQGENLFPWMSGETAQAPDLTAYIETGLWFSSGGKGDFQKNRLKYPGITGLLSFDHGMSQEIVLNPDFDAVVVTAKHRAIVNGHHKLVYMPTEKGVRFALFDESTDPDNLEDLAANEPLLLKNMKTLFFENMTRLEPRLVRVGDYLVKK